MAPLRTCRALAFAWAFMCVLAIPPAVHAQSAQPAHPAKPAQSASSEGEDGPKLPVSLDRIREGVQRTPKLKIDYLDPSIPLFRTSVTEKGLKLSDYWKIGPDTAVSRDVRPSFASTWHHEFLSMTIPKQQIAASAFGIFGNPIHPVGPPALEITKALKSVFSNAERGRIKRQIQAELKEIEANKSQQASQPQQAQQTQETQPAKQPEPREQKPAQPDSKQPRQP
jgi:hypothetical protein